VIIHTHLTVKGLPLDEEGQVQTKVDAPKRDEILVGGGCSSTTQEDKEDTLLVRDRQV
jgi:hypothetical protein